MFARYLFAVLLLIPGSVAAEDAEVESPLAESEELKVLEHYVGEWDIEITSAASTEEVKLEGTSKAKWITGGSYVEQTVTMTIAPNQPRMQMVNIMGWDAEAKKYRTWSFASHSSPRQFDATWDSEKKTMTSVTEVENGLQVTTIANFSKPDIEEWTIVISRKEGGDKLGEVTGISRRKSAK